MFGTNLACGIKSVNVKTQDVDGRLLRRCRVVLSHEFDSDIASAIGGSARVVREGLLNGAIDKAVLPINGLAALGVFVAAGDTVEIPRLTGVKATATKGKEDEPPEMLLEFEFAWLETAWVFLGRHCSAIADVLLTRAQLTMEMDGVAN